MNILYWIVFGLVTGVIANFIDPNAQSGIIGSILLGIFGAVLGGFIDERFFGVGITGFNVRSLIVSVLGALLLLFIGRLLF